MKLQLAIEGSLRAHMDRDARVLARALRAAPAAATDGLKRDARARVRAAFPRSRRLPNTIRSRLYPSPPAGSDEIGGAGIVYSKFGRREGGRFVDYFLPHVLGGEIRPRRGRWLYIPLERGRRAGTITASARRRRLVVGLEKGLRFIPLDGARTLIVKQTRNRSTPVALLIRRASLRRKLDFRSAEASADRRLTAAVLDGLERIAG